MSKQEKQSSEDSQELPLHNRKQPLSAKANETSVPNLTASWEKEQKNIKKKVCKAIAFATYSTHQYYVFYKIYLRSHF